VALNTNVPASALEKSRISSIIWHKDCDELKFAEIKIWRIDNHHRFTTKDDYIFKKIKPHLHNAIKNIYQKNQTTYKNKTNVKLNQTYLSKTYALTHLLTHKYHILI
jgi:hypothetical protein